MIVRLVLGFLADAIFDSVMASRRSFAVEMDRYLVARGLAGKVKSRQGPPS